MKILSQIAKSVSCLVAFALISVPNVSMGGLPGWTSISFSCDSETSAGPDYLTGSQGYGAYSQTQVYNGNCTATIDYFFNGTQYESETYNVYNQCNCGADPYSNEIIAGEFNDISVASVPVGLSTLFYAGANIDHFNLYDLTSSNAVSSYSTTSNAVTISSAALTTGHNFLITACTADNLIQGGLGFKASTSGITTLPQARAWQNVLTNLPGTTILVEVATNQLATMSQYAGGLVAFGSGAIVAPPTLSIASVATSQAALFWPASATNFVLQSTTNLASPNWVTITNGTPITGVILPNARPASFYRLQLQP